MRLRQRCVDIVVVRENAYYFSLFLNLKISLFLVGQGWQPCVRSAVFRDIGYFMTDTRLNQLFAVCTLMNSL